jgi:hypothetical protein
MITTELNIWFWYMVLCKCLWYLVYGEYGVLQEVYCWLTW